MKSTNIFASLLLIGAVIASGSAAQAGTGGVAAAVSAQLSGGAVTSVSSAIGVGKNSAAAAARTTTAGDTYAVAVGAAGLLQVTNANASNVGFSALTDTDLATDQANVLGATITNGATTVTIP
jgi:hypothetical protein